jgi:hypothetical protein
MDFFPKDLNPLKIQIKFKFDLLPKFLIQILFGIWTYSKNESCSFGIGLLSCQVRNCLEFRDTSFILCMFESFEYLEKYFGCWTGSGPMQQYQIARLNWPDAHWAKSPTRQMPTVCVRVTLCELLPPPGANQCPWFWASHVHHYGTTLILFECPVEAKGEFFSSSRSPSVPLLYCTPPAVPPLLKQQSAAGEQASSSPGRVPHW